MPYLKNSLLALLLCSITLLTACGEDNSKKITAVDDPELVAIAFFDALYNEKNVEKAASVCNPQLARLILHYRSPGAVARHLFNMSYDKVEIKPDSAGVKVREQFKDNANITIYFDGYYQNNRMKDVKRLAIIQRDGKWFIDKVLKDPF
ncbi:MULTISPECIES: hypothetical protein [Colwellia]|uniref:Putative lipoprotein n=1 Tax=Colwellia psychrerythraea (strain 34H / ATCC BAA-681) TaxID=167879 RepID=Q482P2_COLP3|nr:MULTISPECIES: hypothetical protein [Colwellia]AAZ26226.1 putative lipoprotein [Colwellia psychrerythraea 34H]PKH87850.1 hypothetical protein CXF79_14605 [Colwellia sp. Bg11-28]